MNLIRWLKEVWNPQPLTIIRRTIDFTKPDKDHWAGFDYGDNHDARFTIRGFAQRGDDILVRLRSGNIGVYRLFSVQRDFTGQADYRVRGYALGYYRAEVAAPIPHPVQRMALLPAPKVTPLLTDGTWRPRPNSGQLLNLSGGTFVPTSEQWKVLVRDEARRARADNLRSAGNL